MRLSLGTYQSANSPITSPHAQVQIHQRAPAGTLSRTMSRTTSATAHPAVPTQVTTWSFASSDGGGEGRASGSRVGFTPSGYEVPRGGCAWFSGVMYLVHAVHAVYAGPDEGYR